MHPMTSGNICCRKNKIGLFSHSRELGCLEITKYDNTALVKGCECLCYDESSRFLCFDKEHSIRGPVGPGRVTLFTLSSINSHSLKFSVKVVQYYRKFSFDSGTSENRTFDITICIANRY